MKFANRVLALGGGRDRFRRLAQDEYQTFMRVWDRDTAAIGRVVRAHFTVEHFLTLNLTTANPRLGNLASARLNFAQKLALLHSGNAFLQELVPGIRRLNEIRNRFVHTVTHQLSTEDVAPLLQIPIYRALRTALAKPARPTDVPIEVIEEFARFAASTLGSETSETGRIIHRALAENAAGEQPPGNDGSLQIG